MIDGAKDLVGYHPLMVLPQFGSWSGQIEANFSKFDLS